MEHPSLRLCSSSYSLFQLLPLLYVACSGAMSFLDTITAPCSPIFCCEDIIVCYGENFNLFLFFHRLCTLYWLYLMQCFYVETRNMLIMLKNVILKKENCLERLALDALLHYASIKHFTIFACFFLGAYLYTTLCLSCIIIKETI